jgi:hypothetical protein
VALTIRDPELQKVQGRRCPNARPDNSCAIYDNRPRTCRTFYCGWRQLKWVRQTLRPDISGVLVRLHQEKSQAGEPPRTGVIVTLLNRAALKADGLAESLAAAVAAAVPVYLEVPGPPGYTYGMARINDALIGPVLAKNKATVLVILRQAWAAGRAGAHHPIDMAPDPS